MKLLYPDSLYNLDTISCAIFLYFQDDTFACTLHPTVSMQLADCDSNNFYQYIDIHKPSWCKNYLWLIDSYYKTSLEIHSTSKLLKPIEDKGLLKSVWLIYPKNPEILEKTKELIAKFKISYKELFSIINVKHASQELISHIQFEMFLEIYGGPAEKPTLTYTSRDIDYKKLYEYCDKFFKKNTFEEALVNAYFLRLVSSQKIDNILLSNPKLIPFLNQINEFESISSSSNSSMSYNEQIDIVSWEIFRQLTSPYIDSFDYEKRIKLTETLISNNQDEIKRLKNKCWKLAESFKAEKDIEKLSSNIAKYISVNAEAEIQDLLKLDKKHLSELLNKIFADEKTWIGISSFIISTYSGTGLITTGSAIFTLSNMFAKSIKTNQETNKAIKQSDYSLVYRLKNN